MYTEETLTMLREKAKQLRRDVITCVGVGTAGHVGGSCSSADLVAALYFYKMHYSAAAPKLASRDRFMLDHLAAIVDNNGLQATGRLKDRMDPGDLKAKWAAFGWNVIEIDGHDMKQIVDALDQADLVQGRPTVILAHTVKGKGISFAENVPSFHNGTLTQELYDQAMRELQ